MGEGCQRHAPAALPAGKIRYLLYRRLGGHQSRSGQVRKISPPPGFDPRGESLYRLRYPSCHIYKYIYMYTHIYMHSKRCNISAQPAPKKEPTSVLQPEGSVRGGGAFKLIIFVLVNSLSPFPFSCSRLPQWPLRTHLKLVMATI